MDIFDLRRQVQDQLNDPEVEAIVLQSRLDNGQELVDFVARNLTDEPDSVRIRLIQPQYMIKNNEPTIDGAWFIISYRKRV